MNKRQLILEDGTVFIGEAIGSEKENDGEVIFYTGMTGYQEMMTDPNYHGKIVTMTFPSIGSYGMNRDDVETIKPSINGLIVKELSNEPSNFRSEETVDHFLKKHHIPGISGIDTRMLTRVLREKGILKGKITHLDANSREIAANLQQKEDRLLVKETSISKPYIVPGRGFRVVVMDLGMKHSILHELTARDCNVIVVPYNYSFEDIMQFKPDGVLLSNGPGNPALVTDTINTIQSLLGMVPIFGIGLGHQLFALACGAKTKKMHVGNYGSNYPVKDLQANRAWITTQSRQYYVDESTLTKDVTIMFRSLNDGTIEGLNHRLHPAFSVQFNPEGAPGSNETNFLFDRFLEMMECKNKTDGGGPHA